MSCTYGSRKKEGAPDSISTNDIGAICALFDMEGALCRLLDLIPETIQKILTFNFADDDSLDLFEEILKKVAKKTAELIYEDLTGRINVGMLCSNPPPTQLENVNYSDVFIFISELVPILNYFFLANEVLTGNSTKLLDKIVNTWLRKEWFRHCECIPKPLLPEEGDSFVNPPVVGRCTSNEALQTINNLVAIYNRVNQEDALQALQANILSSASAVEEAISFHTERLTNQGHFNITQEKLPDVIGLDDPPYETGIDFGTGILFLSFTGRKITFTPRVKLNYSAFDISGNVIEEAGSISLEGRFEVPITRTTNYVENCPSPEPPPPPTNEDDLEPDDFCTLFPDDPICQNDDDSACEIERIICEESYCGRFRKPVRRTLNVTGIPENIDCVEFVDCESDRITKPFVLLKCEESEEPPFQCSDYEQAVKDFAYFVAENGLYFQDGDRRYRPNEDAPAFYEEFRFVSDLYSSECEFIHQDYFYQGWAQYWAENPVLGCTDSSAINYNPDASEDDGTCIYEEPQ